MSTMNTAAFEPAPSLYSRMVTDPGIGIRGSPVSEVGVVVW